MSGGLVGLLDDIAALAKLAAASLDDVGAAASRASVSRVIIRVCSRGPRRTLRRAATVAAVITPNATAKPTDFTAAGSVTPKLPSSGSMRRPITGSPIQPRPRLGSLHVGRGTRRRTRGTLVASESRIETALRALSAAPEATAEPGRLLVTMRNHAFRAK